MEDKGFYIFEQIGIFSEYKIGWNYENDLPLDRESLKCFVEFLWIIKDLDIPKSNGFSLTPNGTLEIEWDIYGRGLEIEFLPDYKIEYLCDTGGAMSEGAIFKIDKNHSEVYKLIKFIG